MAKQKHAIHSDEIRNRAYAFMKDYEDASSEKSEAQSFWKDFFNIWNVSTKKFGTFEAKAKTLTKDNGWIDFFWPGTVIIEHKSRGEDLDKAFGQGLDYLTGIKEEELPKYIIVCDFENFRIYDFEEGADTARFKLPELADNLHHFDFILGREKREYKEEDAVNIEVAEIMGRVHDELKESGYEGHKLELLLVRLMFCLFADDTGIFDQRNHFQYYIETFTREDGTDFGAILSRIFQVLNTPREKRQKTLNEDMQVFPYVNGKLFDERVDLADFTKEMRNAVLECCAYDWGKVSPAIFGSMFQSVMNTDLRRNLGAHYTSEKNILKAVHGLFLDDLYVEFEKAKKTSVPALRRLLERIKNIHILDPACGCGNFLIISYRELRRLEIVIHKEINRREKTDHILTLDVKLEYSGIDVDSMYGFEIEEFPVMVARTAMWIMDHIMNVELSKEFGLHFVRLPLVVSPSISCVNALRIDWEEYAPKDKIDYIIGNPPFVGKQYQSSEQKKDMKSVFEGRVKRYKLLDYVTCWYIKAADFIDGTETPVAFVSTNSITQGQQAIVLWKHLLQEGGISINFAHRTFKWNNEAQGVAGVYVVIVGWAQKDREKKRLYEYRSPSSEPDESVVSEINPYLVDGPVTVIEERSSPICNVPHIVFGSMANDGGALFLTPEEKDDVLRQEPNLSPYVRLALGSNEFIKGLERYCLWLEDCPPSMIRGSKTLKGVVKASYEHRSKSKRSATNKLADTPHLFGEIRQPRVRYLMIPKTSSENRRYIPMGFQDSDVVSTDLCLMVPSATMYDFGVLTSEMHMTWMRQVGGRLKGDYRYSNNLVYNNFPWPKNPSAEQKSRVKKAAQAVIDVRQKYLDQSQTYADLYDPLSMPADLLDAHRKLDRAVDRCYRPQPFTTEANRLKFLFERYEEYVS